MIAIMKRGDNVVNPGTAASPLGAFSAIAFAHLWELEGAAAGKVVDLPAAAGVVGCSTDRTNFAPPESVRSREDRANHA